MRCTEVSKMRRILDEAPPADRRSSLATGHWSLATPSSPLATKRRGVTLVEMLVTLAILLLMMTAIVQIFQAATGALNAAQVYQELDNQLRLLDGTMRSDLAGVTCKMTPPNNPLNNPGYFQYDENEFADNQGEDADDILRFTAKAPAGRPFTGRMWVGPQNAAYLNQTQAQNLFQSSIQPITISSEYAEIIYFLRNGNLYRRVLLVAPQLQSTMVPTINNTATVAYGNGASMSMLYTPQGLGGVQVSFQGMNDLSAHPAPTGPDPNALQSHNSVILNTLAHLANRENRWPNQRFANDFQNLTGAPAPDNVVDDFNGDNVPDYYPSLYAGLFVAPTNRLVFEPTIGAQGPNFRLLLAFPYIYPGSYSCPQVLSTAALTATLGWIHSPNPQGFNTATNANVAFDTNPALYLSVLNHNPIDVGDNLPLPGSQNYDTGTWWALPTWRESLSAGWADPTVQVNIAQSQPIGLPFRSTATYPVTSDHNLLPPMKVPGTYTGDFSFIRRKQDLYCDGLGVLSNFWSGVTPPNNVDPLWSQSWEDDLIMTNVRSFDIKAYDNAKADYVDLGWGDDTRITGGIQYLQQTPVTTLWGTNLYDTYGQTFAHEGRMPPLVEDQRWMRNIPTQRTTR